MNPDALKQLRDEIKRRGLHITDLWVVERLDALLASASHVPNAMIGRLRQRLLELADEQNLRQQAVYGAADIRDAIEREDVLRSAAGALASASPPAETPSQVFASEAEYQNHLPWCKARLFGRLNVDRCNCDLRKPAEVVSVPSSWQPKSCIRCEGCGVIRHYLNIAGDYDKEHCPSCNGTGKEWPPAPAPEAKP